MSASISYLGATKLNLSLAHRSRGRLGLRVLGALVLVFITSAAAIAQTTGAATLVGTVRDPSGLPVPQVKVTLVNTETAFRSETTTSAEGDYFIPYLSPGTYQITVTQKGFQTFVADNVPVSVAGERRVDAMLAPGQVESQVVVSADTLPQVETTTPLEVVGVIVTVVKSAVTLCVPEAVCTLSKGEARAPE